MITLGTFDSGIQRSALDKYVQYANKVTGVDWDKLRGEKDGEWVDFATNADDVTVADVQRFLHETGFFPAGQIDGICGYRTTAAIRLFQEYVRTVGSDASIGVPDGMLGPNSLGFIKKWQGAGTKADWTAFSGSKPSKEYAAGVAVLRQIQQRHLANPTKALQNVNGFAKSCDTRKVADWDFGPDHIHLVGVRTNRATSAGQEFNDIFALFIRGIVFTFSGSTDPGKTSNPAGFPFLVPGQHHYRFGWHKLSDQKRVYHALKPATAGVLVVRSKELELSEAALAGALELNNSINIHWGGEGLRGVGGWSEGCQVIAGKGYINHNRQFIDCSSFAAPFYPQIGTKVNGIYQTRGAYTLLTDLVAALSGGSDHIVKYTLVSEEDLSVSPEVAALVADSRQKFKDMH